MEYSETEFSMNQCFMNPAIKLSVKSLLRREFKRV